MPKVIRYGFVIYKGDVGKIVRTNLPIRKDHIHVWFGERKGLYCYFREIPLSECEEYQTPIEPISWHAF